MKTTGKNLIKDVSVFFAYILYTWILSLSVLRIFDVPIIALKITCNNGKEPLVTGTQANCSVNMQPVFAILEPIQHLLKYNGYELREYVKNSTWQTIPYKDGGDNTTVVIAASARSIEFIVPPQGALLRIRYRLLGFELGYQIPEPEHNFMGFPSDYFIIKRHTRPMDTDNGIIDFINEFLEIIATSLENILFTPLNFVLSLFTHPSETVATSAIAINTTFFALTSSLYKLVV